MYFIPGNHDVNESKIEDKNLNFTVNCDIQSLFTITTFCLKNFIKTIFNFVENMIKKFGYLNQKRSFHRDQN